MIGETIILDDVRSYQPHHNLGGSSLLGYIMGLGVHKFFEPCKICGSQRERERETHVHGSDLTINCNFLNYLLEGEVNLASSESCLDEESPPISSWKPSTFTGGALTTLVFLHINKNATTAQEITHLRRNL